MNNLDQTMNELKNLSGQSLLAMVKLNRVLKGIKTKINVKTEYSKEYTDSDGFTYPESINLKFENWNTYFYTYRLGDGKIVGEGSDLNGKGIELDTIIKQQLAEHKEFVERNKLFDLANKSNCIVFDGRLVVVENIEKRFFSNQPSTIFELVDESGQTGEWYGYSPENALNNAAPFLGEAKIVLIRLKSINNEKVA